MSKEVGEDESRLKLLLVNHNFIPPTNGSSRSGSGAISSSFSSKSITLDQEFQLSSDLEEEDESPEEDEQDPLEELRRICASSRFSIQSQSQEAGPSEEGSEGGCKKKRIRKSRRRKKKNPFVIYSNSEYFTEEIEVVGESTEAIGEEETSYSLDQLHQLDLSLDPEFLKDWETHWATHGESILWRTWNEKYKDYINPNYDLVEQLKNVPICSESSSSSSSSEEDEDIEMEGSTTIKLSEKTRQMLKRRLIEKEMAKKKEQSPENQDEMWQETWNNHCQDEHREEYQNFATKYNKMQKLAFITGNAAKNHPKTRKYYAQRYELFSKYDEGIKLDCESWFSVTPENIAIHIAKKCSIIGKDKIMLDAFAGSGGNTIQFAKVFDKVIAIDIDPIKIENCRNNAKIYGVENKIEFIVGDFMKLALETGSGKLEADAVFLSPPWGGPNYQSADVFDITTMIPMNGIKLFKTTRKISNNIAYFLPRNVNQQQVVELAEQGNFVEIENNLHNEKVKTVTAYYGDLIKKTVDPSGGNDN